MGNKTSDEMMNVDDLEQAQPMKSVSAGSDLDLMLEQLDKFIQHREFSTNIAYSIVFSPCTCYLTV